MPLIHIWHSSHFGARRDNLLNDHIVDDDKVVALYKKAVAKGMLKVMGKMGISTLQSYKGAQIFEAIGLQDEVVDRCFVGTASRVQGVDFSVLATETVRRHNLGFPEREEEGLPILANPGEFHWRAEGERHAWDPVSIANLQVASRTNNRDDYWKFAEHINNEERKRASLRGLLEFKPGANGDAIDLEEFSPPAKL